MFRGFYTLSSGMMTQQVNLNVISNNMANASTPGYKKDMLATTTFQDALLARTGNVDKSNTKTLNTVSMIHVSDETVVNHEQGAMDMTGRTFDFALMSSGFFEIQTPEGGSLYTRNGSFTLDDEGYLFLQNVGRVMGTDGPLMLGTDKIEVSEDGTIKHEPTGTELGVIRVVDFENYTALQKMGEGMFENADPQNIAESQTSVGWRMLERSNVAAIDEMTAMLTSQRALQSAGQILKIYDQIMNKAANEIGRL